jgi:hypothetical protein
MNDEDDYFKLDDFGHDALFFVIGLLSTIFLVILAFFDDLL